jgi:hypothetical protein
VSIADEHFSDRQRLTHLIRQADFCLRGGLHGLAAAEIRPNVDWTVDDSNCDQQLFRRAIDKQILSMGYPNNDPEGRTDEHKAYQDSLREERRKSFIGRSPSLTLEWDGVRQVSTLNDRDGRIWAAGFKWEAIGRDVQIPLPGTVMTVAGQAHQFMRRFFVTVAVQTLIWINRPLDRLILALINLLAGPEPRIMASNFPARVLKDPKRFIIDVGKDGFNGYLQCGRRLELVAASSAMSTYMRMMQDMIKRGTGTRVVFRVYERDSEVIPIP